MPHEAPSRGGGRPQGALERALVALTIEAQLAVQERERALAHGRAGEWDQQVRVQISGAATEVWGHADVPVTWEHPFVYSPAQRALPFETPHYTYGVEFTRAPAVPVLIVPSVIRWLQTDASWFIGATLRVAVFAPAQQSPIAYSAALHLNFQGYAYPTEESE